MKIGIVTLNDYSNYGNRLQNYAVCRLLQNYGYSVETIAINEKDNQSRKNFGIKQFIKRLLPCWTLLPAVRANNFVKAVLLGNTEAKRIRVFLRFTILNISQKNYTVKKYEDLKNLREIKNMITFLLAVTRYGTRILREVITIS